ncbi:MAG TPA: hypothetical protein VLW06_07655 [Terriglobales bacterium]|nr:hypothetical protein [Terriglobales bacterium]
MKTPLPETLLGDPRSNAPQVVIEEMACVIADAQAALFAGRYKDLETCATRLQDLCASFRSAASCLGAESAKVTARPQLLLAVRNAHLKNKVFAAALRRMRRHLETLRVVVNGPSLTYEPKTLSLPERKS